MRDNSQELVTNCWLVAWVQGSRRVNFVARVDVLFLVLQLFIQIEFIVLKMIEHVIEMPIN